MFFNYLTELCGLGSYDRIVLLDFQDLIDDSYLPDIAEQYGCELIYYEDIEKFRYIYETVIKKSGQRYLVVLKEDIYLPYDIREKFHCKEINYHKLFPRLNSYALENFYIFDLDLLYIAHKNLYRTISSEAETGKFLSEEMFSQKNLSEYVEYLAFEIKRRLKHSNYLNWFRVALLHSKLEYIKYRCGFKYKDRDLVPQMQSQFRKFILGKYSSLSGYSAHKGPVLLNRGLDYIFMNSKKVALIVMDGMSIIDWFILAEGLEGISHKYRSTYGIIPTITPISRQSLLSGKLPVEMDRPFSMIYEERMFMKRCMDAGYREDAIKYYRGYDFEIGYEDKCICTIINDIDDLVHSQRQGNVGMYHDVKLLANSAKLQTLIKRLYENDFDIYITSDHGHVETEGIGSPRGAGVEVESKSKRALILKRFADYEGIIDEFDMIEYPTYFLPKDYIYLLCEYDRSFGVKGDISLSHGGISIEEVIVPFIEIEGIDV